MSFNSTLTPVLDYFQVSCGAISIFSSVEVLALALTSFSKYTSMYFWSIVICASGCILFAGGFLDLFYEMYLSDGETIYRPLFILTFGWYGMVTGFSVVLYSRLHLVNVPKKYIRLIGMFIIYNIIFSHFPTTVLTFGANIVGTEPWVYGYACMEKLQMTMFCIQEMMLGMLYLQYIRKLTLNKKTTPLVRQTFYINCLVMCLDFAMLIIEYINLYKYQIMLKVVVYAIKLKLEFYILNILSRSLRQNAQNEYTLRGDHHNVTSKEIDVKTPKHVTGKEIMPIISYENSAYASQQHEDAEKNDPDSATTKENNEDLKD